MVVASVAGLFAFGWPLLWQTTQVGAVAIGHTTDAPWLFVLLLPLLVGVVLAELAEGGMDAKVVALLGMLAAVGAALRALGPGTAGLEPGFFLLVLAAYSVVSGICYGLIMNLWFWPYATFGSDFSFVPGDALADNLHRYLLFFAATSLGWDVPRGVLSALLVVTLGRPVLAAFRRAARKAAFDVPVSFVPAEAHHG